MSFLRDLPSVQQSLVYKMRPERISVLSESLPSLSSLYDDDCDARDVFLMIIMTIINMMTMMTIEDGGNDRNDHHNDDDNSNHTTEHPAVDQLINLVLVNKPSSIDATLIAPYYLVYR